MAVEAVGVEVATVLMLRQLYVLVGKLHDTNIDGFAALQADLIRQINAAMQGDTEDMVASRNAAVETVNGVFHTITDAPPE